MERERTFTEKLIVNAWDIIVFMSVFIFILEFPIYIWEIFNFNIKNIGLFRLPLIIGLLYLYGKSDDIKSRDSLTVERFEKRLVLSYRCASDENKTTVKNTLKLKDYDQEKY